MDVDALRGAWVAVVGLDTTTGTPPLITELAVVYAKDGVITAGPLVFWVDPDAPVGTDVRPQTRAQTRLAPRWPEVADRVLDALSGRVVVTHDADRLDIVRRHLPDWQPVEVAYTRDLAGLPGRCGREWMTTPLTRRSSASGSAALPVSDRIPRLRHTRSRCCWPRCYGRTGQGQDRDSEVVPAGTASRPDRAC